MEFCFVGDCGTETAGTDADLDQYHTDGSQKLSGTLYLCFVSWGTVLECISKAQ